MRIGGPRTHPRSGRREAGPVAFPAYHWPSYSPGEHRADTCIHIVGVIAGLAGAAVLMIVALLEGSALAMIGLALYGGGLLAMLGCSALYNMTAPSAWKERLRRLDHAAIFIMIAGTYTPFALLGIGGLPGWELFGFVWLVAIGGAAMKLVLPRRLERVSIALYLLLGWSILAAPGALLSALPPPAVALLATGGLLYSLGVLFHLWDRLPYHNAVWHALVLAAAGSHYAAILFYIALPR